MGHAFTKYVYGPEGQRGTVHFVSERQWACPCCGFLGREIPVDEYLELPYGQDPNGDCGSHWLCPCCHIQYGLNDWPEEHETSLDIIWSRLRIEELNQVGWDEPSLAQLRENLDLTHEQLEAERAEYEADPAWPRGGNG